MEIGDGCALRVLQDEDGAELFSLVERSREHLRVWLPDVTALSRGEIGDFLRRASERRARGDGVFHGICVAGELAGTLGVGIDRKNRAASLGFWIAGAFEGRGVVTRAVWAVGDELFREAAIERIEIRAQPGNLRSRAVAERCRFTHEGTLRKAAWVHDRFVDLCVYGLVREDWVAAR